MKLAVVGGRGFDDWDKLEDTLNYMIPRLGVKTIVSGGAKGADSLAERYAKENKIPFVVFRAEWDKYGNSAGFRRNEYIVQYSDFLIAFKGGKGTEHSISLARKKGIPVMEMWK